MSEISVENTQNEPDKPRARTHAPNEPGPAGPAIEVETQNGLVETGADDVANPDVQAGEAMVSLLASRAALPRKVIDAIERGLTAKKWTWCVSTKQRVYDEDHRAQMDAAKMYLEYVVGRPAERALVITNGKGEGVTLDDLMASPALRKALARRLALAEGCS